MKAAEPHGTRRAGWISARLDRVRLDRVPVATRPWIVACWVLTLAIAVLLLVPGLADDVTVDPVGAAHILDRFLAPAWLRMLLVVACGGVAAVAAVLALLRRSADPVGSSRLRREAALALVAFPPLALVADRILIPAVAAGLLAIMAEVLAHSGRPTRARAAWVGVIAFLPWAVLAATQPFVATDGWTWAVLFGLAAGFAAFGSYYGVQRAAESRTAAVAFLFRTRIPPIGVLGIVAAVVALVVLRLTVLREAFPEPDPTLWSPFAKESPLSWVHAALVALLIVLVGWRSTRRPLRRFGERRIAAALAAVGNVELVLGSVVIVGAFLVAVVVGAADLPDAWLAWVPALKVGGVVVIGLSALLPWMRGTAARVLAAITAVYLLPATTQTALVSEGIELPPGIAGFAATPVQVMLLLLAAALVLALVGLARAPVPRPFVLRLAIVPFIAVHAGWLLPVAWSDLGRWLLVLGIVASLVLFLPTPDADPARRGIGLLAASGAQLLAITVAALAIPSLYEDGTLVVLGLLWLAVTVVVSLVIETRDGDGDRDEEALRPG
jgi:hypothetical protein